MSVNLGYPVFKAFTPAGVPAAGYKVQTHAGGGSAPLPTYTTADLSVANPNPVILDANGEAQIWLAPLLYKIILMDNNDVTVWTMDNINGAAGGATGSGRTDLIASGAAVPLGGSAIDTIVPLVAIANDALNEISGGRFTAQQGGTYFINGQAALLSAAGTTGITGGSPAYKILKNGSLQLIAAQASWPFADSLTRQMVVPIVGPVPMNAGDFVQLACSAAYAGTAPTCAFSNVSIRRIL